MQNFPYEQYKKKMIMLELPSEKARENLTKTEHNFTR